MEINCAFDLMSFNLQNCPITSRVSFAMHVEWSGISFSTQVGDLIGLESFEILLLYSSIFYQDSEPFIKRRECCNNNRNYLQ